MARRPIAPAELVAISAEQSRPHASQARLFDLEQFGAAAPKKKKVKRRDFSAAADEWVEKTAEMIALAKEGDPKLVWSNAHPENLVALFAIMHEHVYGVIPQELSAEWMAARSSAAKMLLEEFGSAPLPMVDYLRETFAREKRSESKRAADSTWRISWRHCFTQRKLLTDYRVAQERASRKRGK